MSRISTAAGTVPGPAMHLEPAPGGHVSLQQAAVELWNSTCGLPMRSDWRGVPTRYGAFIEHLYHEHEQERPRLLSGKPAHAITTSTGDPKQCWAAYSGGKDGLVAALLARDAGYDVTLFHVRGLNKDPAPAEYEAAMLGAEQAGLPIVVDRVRFEGKRAGLVYVPTRNQVVTMLMLAHMLGRDGTGQARTYSLGNSHRDMRTGYLVTHGDLVQAMALWVSYLQELVPGLEQRTWMKHQSEAAPVMLRHGLLEVPHGSCMAPLRFRASYRATNERRYGPLLPGRCGSCGKCCWEYLVLQDIGYGPAVALGPEYRAHCLAYLRRRMREWQTVAGGPQPELSDAELHDKWAPPDVVGDYLLPEDSALRTYRLSA